MCPHAVEELNSNACQRWKDDGGAVPMDRASPTTGAVLTLGKWTTANGGFAYTKATHRMALYDAAASRSVGLNPFSA